MKKIFILIASFLIVGMLFFMLNRSFKVYAATDYVIDTFTRTVSNGWGDAETGGTYGGTSSSLYNVTGNVATISNTAGATRVANSSSVSAQDTQHIVRIKAGTAPAGGNMQLAVVGRNIGSNTYYRGKVVFTTSQQILVNFSKLISGSETDISTSTTLATAFTQDTYYWVKFQIDGTSPTNLRLKVWQVGSSEPGSWDKTATDSEASLQTSGSVALQTYVSGASTVAPVLFTFDDYEVTDIPLIPTNTPTPTSTPTPTPTPVYTASDTFTRTESNGWGSADTGGNYTRSGGNASDYAVNGAAGTMTYGTVNTNKRMYLDGLSREDIDISVKLKTDKLAVGGTMYSYLLARRNAASNHEYFAQTILHTNGKVGLRIVKLISGSESALTTEYIVPELLHVSDTYINVRMQVYGTNPTTIRAKMWGEGWKEPPEWQATVTDSQAELQTVGSIGVRSFVGSSSTNAPIVFSYDSLSAAALNNTTVSSLSGSYANKGVNWHMGAWYNTIHAPNAYYWEGMYTDLDKMADAGIQWVRFTMNTGTQTQCAPDKFYTKLATAFRDRNMKGLVYVSIPNATTTTASADEISTFSTWLNTMVNCYKNDFDYWEIGNEPNLSAYWNIDDDEASDQSAYEDSVGWYYEFLEAGYTTIKAVDPGATVIHAGLSQYKSDRWYDAMETINPSSYMDAMAFHPYSDLGPDGSINYINRLYAKMQTISGMENKPIWITEIGYTSDADQYPGNTGGSETLKASYLSSSYQKMLDWGISAPIFWFNFTQDASVNADGYELLYSDRSALTYLARNAYTAMTNLWVGGFAPTGKPGSPHVEVSSTNKPYCADATPGGSPELFQITTEDTKATIYFSPAQGPINSYHISYGHASGNYMYGVVIPGQNDDGVRSFTIGALKPNTKYFFKVMPIHGCAPGVSSNELSATTSSTSGDTFSFYK